MFEFFTFKRSSRNFTHRGFLFFIKVKIKNKNPSDLMRLYEDWEIPVLFDRHRNKIPKSQIGFINFVVFPLHKIWKFLLGDAHRKCIKNIDKNIAFWDDSKALRVLGCNFQNKPVQKIPWQTLVDLPSHHKRKK